MTLAQTGASLRDAIFGDMPINEKIAAATKLAAAHEPGRSPVEGAVREAWNALVVAWRVQLQADAAHVALASFFEIEALERALILADEVVALTQRNLRDFAN